MASGLRWADLMSKLWAMRAFCFTAHGKRGCRRHSIFLTRDHGAFVMQPTSSHRLGVILVLTKALTRPQQLCQTLSRCFNMAQVVLVFDAMGGMSRTTMRTTNAGAIDVVYCAAEEADSWIVQEVRRAGLQEWHHASMQTPSIDDRLSGHGTERSLRGPHAGTSPSGKLRQELERVDTHTLYWIIWH